MADEFWSIQIKNNLIKAQGDEIKIVAWTVHHNLLTTIDKTPPEPPSTLKPFQLAFLQWTVADAIIGNNASAGLLGIQTPKGYFGMMLWYGGSIFKIGAAPRYYVFYGTEAPKPDQWRFPVNFFLWQRPEENPATGWTFPNSVGYRVQIENTVNYPGIQMVVNIQDL